jgi:hypothetical protein
MKMIRFTGLALICALSTTIHAQSYKVLGNFNDEPSQPIVSAFIAQSRGGYLLSTRPQQYANYSQGGLAFRAQPREF